MKQYVSLDKRSKKAQKEYYSKQRRTWGKLNPVTRSVPNGKTYNRNKDKQERRRIGKEFRDEFDADFFVSFYTTGRMTKGQSFRTMVLLRSLYERFYYGKEGGMEKWRRKC